jgi:hypothetical protein
MKKYLTVYVALCLVLFSCEKENKTQPENVQADKKTFEATFKIGTDITGSKSTLAAQGKKKTNVYSPVNTQFITALFYDANSVLIKRIDQASADQDYGTIKINLPLATQVHAFFIAASDNTYTITLKKGNTDNLSAYPGGYPVLNYPNTIFPPSSEIYTTARDYYVIYPISEDVQLNRAVSKLTIYLTDNLPESAGNTALEISQPQYSSALDLVNGVGDKPYTAANYGLLPLLSPLEVRKAGVTRSTYIWPSNSASIKIFNGSFSTADVPVPDGKFMPNQQYTFKGALFTDTRQYFGFSINADWKDPITIPIPVPYFLKAPATF